MRSMRAVAAVLIAACATPAWATEPIVLTSMLSKEDAPVGKLNYLIYNEAFRRLGYELVLVKAPPLRGGMYADKGIVDGELGRGKDYGDSHPNLVRVNEPALSLTLAAYALSPTLKLKNWDSMQGDRWRVEYQRGMQMPSARLASVVPASQQSTISSPRLGLRKLAAGRTDIYVDFAEHIDPLLKSEPFTFSELVVKAGNMERVAIHAYLNRRHAALEPKLSAVLRDMKSEGLIKAYAQQANHATH